MRYLCLACDDNELINRGDGSYYCDQCAMVFAEDTLVDEEAD